MRQVLDIYTRWSHKVSDWSANNYQVINSVVQMEE